MINSKILILVDESSVQQMAFTRLWNGQFTLVFFHFIIKLTQNHSVLFINYHTKYIILLLISSHVVYIVKNILGKNPKHLILVYFSEIISTHIINVSRKWTYVRNYQ